MPELSREELENRLYYLQREFQGLVPGPGRTRTEVEARLAMCKMALQSLTRAELLTKCRYLLECAKMNLELQKLEGVPLHIETAEMIDKIIAELGE